MHRFTRQPRENNHLGTFAFHTTPDIELLLTRTTADGPTWLIVNTNSAGHRVVHRLNYTWKGDAGTDHRLAAFAIHRRTQALTS